MAHDRQIEPGRREGIEMDLTRREFVASVVGAGAALAVVADPDYAA